MQMKKWINMGYKERYIHMYWKIQPPEQSITYSVSVSINLLAED